MVTATNVAKHSCFGPEINISKEKQQVQAYWQCTIPTQLIILKETNFITNTFDERKNTVACKKFLASQAVVIRKWLENIARKAERQLHQHNKTTERQHFQWKNMA